MEVFYDHLAEWWPVISPLSDYTGECAEIRRVLKALRPEAQTTVVACPGDGINANLVDKARKMGISVWAIE